jgi:hypothetical protein
MLPHHAMRNEEESVFMMNLNLNSRFFLNFIPAQDVFLTQSRSKMKEKLGKF